MGTEGRQEVQLYPFPTLTLGGGHATPPDRFTCVREGLDGSGKSRPIRFRTLQPVAASRYTDNANLTPDVPHSREETRRHQLTLKQ